jgi:hypothetical protein
MKTLVRTRDVKAFVFKVQERLRVPLTLTYYPAVHQGGRFDLYSISMKGRTLLNFSSENFANETESRRLREMPALLRIGLNANLSNESMRDAVEIPRAQGIKLIWRGTARR